MKDGQTALMCAAEAGKNDVIDVLAELGSGIDAKTEDGVTALMFAAGKGNLETAKLLVSKGASINEQAEDASTALTYAANAHSPEIIKFLIEKGADIVKSADVNAQNKEGVTALSMASGAGQTEIARLLIEKGADIDAQNKEGETALMWASWFGHVETAGLLIELGADVNIRSINGGTALLWASGQGRYVIDAEKLRLTTTFSQRVMAEILAKKGAKAETFVLSGGPDICVESQDERTADYDEIVKMLKEAGAKKTWDGPLLSPKEEIRWNKRKRRIIIEVVWRIRIGIVLGIIIIALALFYLPIW